MTPRKPPTRAVIALGLITLTTPLPACSRADPQPSTTTPVAADATITVPTPSPTTTHIDVLADMPPTTKQKDDAGAEAFVRYFYDAANHLAMNPRTGEIAKLCDTEVPLCAQWEKSLASYIDRGIGQERPIFRVTQTDPMKEAAHDPENYLVITLLEGMTQVMRASGDNTSATVPGKGPMTQVISLSWRGDRWFITRVEEVA